MENKKKIVDILFVIPPYHQRNGSGCMFPLGIGSIMACLEQKGFTYDYIDCTRIINTLRKDDLKKLKIELTNQLANFNPSLVGIGPCVTPGVNALKIVTKCCKEAFGTEKIFAGGPFVTMPTQEWYFYESLGLKYLIKGEGEKAVCEAVETVKLGLPLENCSVISFLGRPVINTVTDLDALPFPKRINLINNVYSDRRKLECEGLTAHMVASRGCPYCCDYCVSGNLKEIPFRKRSAKNIVAEMKYLSTNYGVTDIIFYDDCFFSGNRTLHDEIAVFCEEIQAANISLTWQIEIRPDIIVEISDAELILLSKCGCRQMNIGVEKTNSDGAACIGKCYDFIKLKAFLAHIHTVCPIKTTGTFILGGKNETEETVRELIQESTMMNLDDVGYSPLFVYPDTPIYMELFTNPRDWIKIATKETIGEIIYENSYLSKEKLIELVNDANKIFFHGKPQEGTDRVKDRYHLKG